jgi:ADP-heptose:LPS heptosyltransferase
VSKNLIGYGTSGFGFLLNYQVKWQIDAHETRHILDVLQALEPDYSSINVNIFDNYLSNCDEVINKYGVCDGQYIVIHATSQDANKDIPENVLAKTVKYIMDNTTCFIIFVGLANEVSYINDSITFNHERMVITNGIAKFFEVYCLLSKAKAFVGVDSSIAHLSSSLKTPKIIVWHSQNILNQWKPLGDNVYIIDNVNSSNVIIDQLIAIIENDLSNSLSFLY